MTYEEARLVARLIGFADNACEACVRNLVEKANALFPDLAFTVDARGEIWDTDFPTYEEDGVQYYERRIEVAVATADMLQKMSEDNPK